jgi:TMEM175 potassium channel family protein
MTTAYNQIAGQSVERLAALSDGIFAVAMTLLVLDLKVPASEAVHSERDLGHVLLALAPRLLVYLMSFLTLGIFWVGQQTQLNHLARSDRSLSWIHLAFLFAVSLTPFSTSFLAEYLGYRLALLTYWFNIFLLGTTLYFTWVCAIGNNLVRDDISPALRNAIQRRIVVAQSLYALGAALCFFSTYLSIAFIVAVQLNYAIAPRLRKGS